MRQNLVGDVSDDDELVQDRLQAAKVFGQARANKGSLKADSGERKLLPDDTGAIPVRKKRRRAVIYDEDNMEEGQPEGCKSSASGGSAGQMQLPSTDLEVVPDSSEEGSIKQSSLASKRPKSEILPSSFYGGTASRGKPEENRGFETHRNEAGLNEMRREFTQDGRKTSAVVHIDLVKPEPMQSKPTEDPVDHALRECEKIASTLRQQLHLAEGATEGYNEVEGSATRLVSQAEITEACASDSTDGPTLKPYQLIGVNFLLLLHHQGIRGAICADEMGLGKTVQAITYLGLLSQEVDQGPHLVVCPASLLDNWSREFKLWCPALTVLVYHGSERTYIRQSVEDEVRKGVPASFNVLLTTYSLFERKSTLAQEDRRFLRRFDWNCVVMDEAHLLKDYSSMRTQKLRGIASGAKCRLMLTGTPLQNDLQELWTLLNFLLPDIFQLKDLEAAIGPSDDPDVHAGLIRRLKTILAPFVLRRVKADVMQQLVAKEQKVETVAMHPAQGELYRGALVAYKAQVGGSGHADKLPKRQITNVFTHLRKIANHPLLVRNKFSDQNVREIASKLHSWGVYNVEASVDRVYEELIGYSDYELHRICDQYQGLADRCLSKDEALASGKCKVLSRLLSELQSKGSRPLIFSQWTAMLDILEWVMELLGFSYVRLDGATQVSDRQGLVDEFNSNEGIFAFLLSTRAGGQGLNLTGADTVILHDVDFNPQVDRQAEDRCHRIGQTKPVTVYRLVSLGTVDESILKIANRKLSLDAAVLTDTGKVAGDLDSKSMGEILASLLADV